jgi:hypothetical protein
MRRMTLSSVKEGRLDVPIRVLLYGVEGVGKSTFAAAAPKPIFLGADNGTAQLDVARFPDAKSWEDVIDAIDTLHIEAHDYETLVIDTLDSLEPLCWDHVCANGIEDGKRGLVRAKRLVDFGFGKGYDAAVDTWRSLTRHLERLIAAKRMHLVMLAHATIKTFKNPEGEDYDRYILKMHEKSAGYLKEWSEDVLFAKHEIFSAGKDTRKAVSDGARVVHTTRMAPWDAKNRNGLPATIPLSWEDYWAGVKAHAPRSLERLVEDIREMIPKLDTKDAARVEAGLVKCAGDAIKLSVLLDWCKGKAGIEQAESTTTPKEEAGQ